MIALPFKFKFGFYAAALATVALIASSAALLPFIYLRQVAELDEQLADNANDLYTELKPRLDDLGPNETLSQRFVPSALRLRYLEVEDTRGRVFYRSSNLRDTNLELPPGTTTMLLFSRNCRINTIERDGIILHVGTRLGTIEGMQENLRFSLLFIIPTVGGLVFIGGIFLGLRAIRPVTELTAAAERIGTDRPNDRLPVPEARDEISRLTEVLNDSFDRLQRAYASAQHFSSDASHQLKTPIAIIRAGLGVLRADESLTDTQIEEIETLQHQTLRLSAIIEDLLLLAQADAGKLQLDSKPTDLAPLLEGSLEDLRAHAELSAIEVEAVIPGTLFAKADLRRVNIIVQNLCENAVKYCSTNGKVRLTAETHGGYAYIRVANSGPAIPPTEWEQIFERFHRGTNWENASGHGLGLNIARELARAHGGGLKLSRSDGELTEFELWLPA